MFICPTITLLYLFRYLALAILSITLVQGFKAPGDMNVSELLTLNSHIKTKPISKPENLSGMNYSALKPVLFEKLYNIKLSCSVFRVTTFFQFESTNVELEFLLHYAYDVEENQKKTYSKLVTKNNFDHKSYDVRQHVLAYLALLKLCTDELVNCKLQITQLTTQINNLFFSLD